MGHLARHVQPAKDVLNHVRCAAEYHNVIGLHALHVLVLQYPNVSCCWRTLKYSSPYPLSRVRGCTHATNLEGVFGLFVPLVSEVDSVVVGLAVPEAR